MTIYGIFVLIVGFCVGSFLNVCIIRIPNKTFFKSMRSLCPHCLKPIPFYLNIPLVSYLFLRGKTSCCHKKISFQYFLVETLTGIGFYLFYQKYTFISPIYGFLPDESLRFFHGITFFSLLMICTFIDFKLKIIPDVISLPMILVSPLVAYCHPGLSVKESLTGVFAGAFIIYAVAWIYYLIRKEEGIGMGDAKLLAAIGGWLGYKSLLPTLFFASISGSLAGISWMIITRNYSSKAEIPFGPFLSFAAIIYLGWGELFLF